MKILVLIVFGQLTILPVHTLSYSSQIPQLGKVMSMKLVRRKRMSKQARADRTSTKYFLSWMSRWRRTQIEVTLPIRPSKDMTGITTAYITHLNVPAILCMNMRAYSLQSSSAAVSPLSNSLFLIAQCPTKDLVRLLWIVTFIALYSYAFCS